LFRCPVIGKPLSSAGVDFEGNCRVQSVIVSARMNIRMTQRTERKRANYMTPRVTAARSRGSEPARRLAGLAYQPRGLQPARGPDTLASDTAPARGTLLARCAPASRAVSLCPTADCLQGAGGSNGSPADSFGAQASCPGDWATVYIRVPGQVNHCGAYCRIVPPDL
jgi:hypothetical protein